jgi:hypothetical protein
MATPSVEVLRIHIPASPAHLRDVRAFIGAVARHVRCPDETIEDLRLLASEVCAQAFDEGIAPDGIDLRAGLESDALVVEIEPVARFADTGISDPIDASSGERRWALLTALFPDLERAEVNGSTVLRVRVPGEGPASA